MNNEAEIHDPIERQAAAVSLPQLFWIFFRIACTGFGGFMAMISLVQNVIVERRKLLSHNDMLEGMTLCSLLPGPMAINLVAYVGYRLRGTLGALVSATAAVLPALAFIIALGMAYFRWGEIPAVGKVFLGFVPAVTAIIVAAAWHMARKSVVGIRAWLVAPAAAAVLLGIGGPFSTLAIIVGAGLIGWLCFNSATQPNPTVRAKVMLAVSALTPMAPLLSIEPTLLGKIFLAFAGMSLMLFGGAYVFIPLIQEIVVDGLGWVSPKEFVDAVAMSQMAPGPVMVVAAFIGLKIAGLAGALVATLGIFAPSAILTIACSHVLERIKHSAAVQSVLAGVRPAVVGMIFAAAVVIGKSAPPAWTSVAIFVVALLALLRFRIEAVWIIPPAGLIGYLAY